MSDPIIRGTLPAYHTGPFRRAENGICTGTAYRLFPIGPVNQRINPAWLSPAAAPDPFGGVPFTGEAAADAPANGLVKVTYNYTGVESSFEADEVASFTVKVNPTSLPIQQHPRFAALEKLWGPYDEELGSFPKYLAKGANLADETPEDEATASGAKISPGWGLSQWYAFGIVITMRKVLKSGSKAEMKKVGQIDTPPAAALEDIDVPGGGNWAVTNGQINKHGNRRNYVRELELEWTHGHPRPWPSPIYKRRG